VAYDVRVPRLLAFIPHPDDESYSFGGTLALAARAGWECFVYCASSGEKGKRHDGGETTLAATGALRERELEASCALLGCRPPVFLRLRDGGLRQTPGATGRIGAAIELLRPGLVLTLGPDGAYGHPDHIALHRWVLEGWQRAGRTCPLLFPVFPTGLFVPQWEKCRGMMGEPPDPPASAIGADTWDYSVDIGRVRETKLAAIAAHRSQLPWGDPEAIFPPGIVRALLETERFADATGAPVAETAALLSFG